MLELIDQYWIAFIILTILISIGFLMFGVSPGIVRSDEVVGAPASIKNNKQISTPSSWRDSWERFKFGISGLALFIGVSMMAAFLVLALFHGLFVDTSPACGRYEDLEMCIESSPDFSE